MGLHFVVQIILQSWPDEAKIIVLSGLALDECVRATLLACEHSNPCAASIQDS